MRLILIIPGPPPTKIIGFPLSKFLCWFWSDIGADGRGIESSLGWRFTSVRNEDDGIVSIDLLIGANGWFLPPFDPINASHFNGCLLSLYYKRVVVILLILIMNLLVKVIP